MNEAPNLMDWQQEFIAANLLAIGYNAWAGYLENGRGAIAGSTNSPAIGTFWVYRFISIIHVVPFAILVSSASILSQCLAVIV